MDEEDDNRAVVGVGTEISADDSITIEECVRQAQRLSLKIHRLINRARKSRRGAFPHHGRRFAQLARLRYRAKQRLDNHIARAVHPIIYRAALKRADSEADAADVAAVALTEIVQRLDSYAWQSPFIEWCRGFVRNRWRDRLRCLIRYRTRLQTLESLAKIDPRATQLFTGVVARRPDEVACSASEVEHIETKLRSLPPDCQKRLMMQALDRIPMAEMAEMFGETPEQAKNRLRHCRDLARQKLQAE